MSIVSAIFLRRCRNLQRTFSNLELNEGRPKWICDQNRSAIPEICHTKERLKVFKLPTLNYQRKRRDMIMCYKILQGLVDSPGNLLKLPRPSQRSLRGKSMIYIGRTNFTPCLPLTMILNILLINHNTVIKGFFLQTRWDFKGQKA